MCDYIFNGPLSLYAVNSVKSAVHRYSLIAWLKHLTYSKSSTNICQANTEFKYFIGPPKSYKNKKKKKDRRSGRTEEQLQVNFAHVPFIILLRKNLFCYILLFEQLCAVGQRKDHVFVTKEFWVSIPDLLPTEISPWASRNLRFPVCKMGRALPSFAGLLWQLQPKHWEHRTWSPA